MIRRKVFRQPFRSRFPLMSSRVKASVVFTSMLLTIMLVVGAVIGRSEEKTDGAYRPLSVYTEVLARIKSDYVEEPDVKKVTRGALQGLVEYLDPMSSYLSAEQYSEYKERIGFQDKGRGWSTGMVAHKRGMYTAVLSVLPGSPADKAGIKPGDLIEAIDDKGTRLMPPALLYARLSGEPGSSVRVLIRSSKDYEDPVEHRLERAKIQLPAVRSEMLDGDLGLIDVSVFDDNTAAETAAAVKKLAKAGAKGLILDLRENSIGDTKLGYKLAELFVSGKELGTLEGQRFEKQTFTAGPKSAITDLPLSILIDRPASGAAEVAAAALLDNHRADVIGETTYGLAAHQETIELEDGGALILSVAKFHRPDGKSLHDDGLEPNYPLEPAQLRLYRNPDQREEGYEDPFLKKAREVLNGTAEAPAAKAA
ncbi:MAG: carboxyl-terminal protease [Acidobacteria bacterium]|nr:carboxyl-terminal protease [Acidobacteriota bacterium]